MSFSIHFVSILYNFFMHNAALTGASLRAYRATPG